MSYERYREIIVDLIEQQTDDYLDLFASSVIRRLILVIEATPRDSLFKEENSLIDALIAQVKHTEPDFDKIGAILDALSNITEEDEEHATEIDMEFTEFMSAMDCWRAFRIDHGKASIAALSEHLMNILDYHYTGDASLEQWLSVKEIADEFRIQKQFLIQGVRVN